MGLPALRTRHRLLRRTPLLWALLIGLSVFAAVQVTDRSGLEAAPEVTGAMQAASVTSATLGGDGSPGNPYMLAANSTVTVLIGLVPTIWLSTLVPGGGCIGRIGHSTQPTQSFDVTAAGPGTSSGVLEGDADEDWFSFSAAAGQTFSIRIQPVIMQEATLEVFDSDGTTLLTFGAEAGEASSIMFTPPSAGAFFVVVRGSRGPDRSTSWSRSRGVSPPQRASHPRAWSHPTRARTDSPPAAAGSPMPLGASTGTPTTNA